MNKENLQYPSLRSDLIDYLKSLSNHEYQKREWVEHQNKKIYDSFDEAVHFLYDDTDLAENPESNIGIFLRNPEEACAIRKLINSIENIFGLYGTNLSDEEYISLSEWEDVLISAKLALDTVSKSDYEHFLGLKI